MTNEGRSSVGHRHVARPLGAWNFSAKKVIESYGGVTRARRSQAQNCGPPDVVCDWLLGCAGEFPIHFTWEDVLVSRTFSKYNSLVS